MGNASGEHWSDNDLLAAARNGDRAALEALLARYQSTIYRFGVRMCGDVEDARDVLQETSLAMARSLPDFRADSSVSTWLYTIARRVCMRKRRVGKFEPRHVESLEALSTERLNRIPAPTRNPEQEAAQREIDAALNGAIASLEPSQREVLVLRDVEGLPAADVGKVLGLSVPAVKSRLHRARVEVRQRLESVLGPPEARRDGCPDVLSLFSRHLEGDLAPAACTEMEAHLSQCPNCTGACEALKRALALCRNARVPELPAAVERSVREALREFLAKESR